MTIERRVAGNQFSLEGRNRTGCPRVLDLTAENQMDRAYFFIGAIVLLMLAVGYIGIRY